MTPHDNALEWIVEDWAENHEFSLEEEIENRLLDGKSVEEIAASVASELKRIERDVIDEPPDIGHLETVSVKDIETLVADLAERLESEKKTESSADSYLPTDDVANVAPSSAGENIAPDNAETVRFQAQAAAKERALAEGFSPEGHRFKLFEISERRAVHGDTMRWEVRDAESGEVVQEGGPLFLDHPAHSDYALADARGRAYGALRDLCDGVYRDLRGSRQVSKKNIKVAESNMDRKKKAANGHKLALLRKQVEGLKLTAAQKAIIADMESQIENLTDEFIVSIGGVMKQEWDPGSSWEIVEANGVSKLVRKETKLDDSAPTKHAYRAGSTMRIDAGVVPEDVVIRECLGENRYKVQSLLTHAVFLVDEADLYDPSPEAEAFGDGGGLGISDIAHLF